MYIYIYVYLYPSLSTCMYNFFLSPSSPLREILNKANNPTIFQTPRNTKKKHNPQIARYNPKHTCWTRNIQLRNLWPPTPHI